MTHFELTKQTLKDVRQNYQGIRTHIHNTLIYTASLRELTELIKHSPVIWYSNTLQHFCAIAFNEARHILDIQTIIL